MSSTLRFRVFLRDLSVNRLWSAWTRSLILCAVVKRCKKELRIREVLHCFGQNILRPRRTLLLSAVAAYKTNGESSGEPPDCSNSITDEDLAALLLDLDGVEDLSKLTLFCTGCSKRVIIDKKYPGVVYCQCKETHPPQFSQDGWTPYMEADDVIIWRKEYKPGQGLYAYKVYGRFTEVSAQDFAAVQIDSDYRMAWDNAVAALSTVEPAANGVANQAVLHWEVLWPRLFANRDYVYIRRHKEFDIKTKCYSHKDILFTSEEPIQCVPPPETPEDRPSVHSHAKRKALETYAKEHARDSKENVPLKDNKVYVIVSKSCRHPKVPESSQVIRVYEYWSHMVVKSLDGPDKSGMEFVLTYYDEPGVGGMPAGVAAWATGRAAPVYLQRMRLAANQYRKWLQQMDLDIPSFTGPTEVSLSSETRDKVIKDAIREQDMESSKQGPDMNEDVSTQERSTQTDIQIEMIKNAQNEEIKSPEVKPVELNNEFHAIQPDKNNVKPPEVKIEVKPTEVKNNVKLTEVKNEVKPTEIKSGIKPSQINNKELNETRDSVKETEHYDVDSDSKDSESKDSDSKDSESKSSNGSWWRYLYPFYYFV